MSDRWVDDDPGIRPGDVVQLRSGGPLMTAYECGDGDDDFVKVHWFHEGEVRRASFASPQLRTVPPEDFTAPRRSPRAAGS